MKSHAARLPQPATYQQCSTVDIGRPKERATPDHQRYTTSLALSLVSSGNSQMTTDEENLVAIPVVEAAQFLQPQRSELRERDCSQASMCCREGLQSATIYIMRYLESTRHQLGSDKFELLIGMLLPLCRTRTLPFIMSENVVADLLGHSKRDGLLQASIKRGLCTLVDNLENSCRGQGHAPRSH